MGPEVQINKPETRKRNTVLVILTIFIAVMILAASVLSYIALQYSNVYRGICIGNLDVSGMSRQEMMQQLESIYSIPASELDITLQTQLAELKVSYPELEVHYDVEVAAEAAYSLGRTGSIFDRLYDIAYAGLSGVVFSVPQSYNEEKINECVTRFSIMAFQGVKEGALLIADDKVLIKSGRHGESIDKAETRSLVIEAIKSGKGGVIEPEVTVTETSRFNADEIYGRIVSSPSEAYYTLENNELVLVPHKSGRQVDKAELGRIIEEHSKTEEQERLLPVVFTKPDVTAEDAASMLFRDELANFSTPFETRTQNEKNRMHNINLAASKYNDFILMPDEEFSFNKVVGPRNEKYGYKEAHIYINGRVEDGVGGGICQAVSTLYNAVLMSDLEVLERKNHSFIVTYVPLGQDATAYYGGTDFRFVNTTGWPIKIISWVEDNNVNIIFKGTQISPEKSIVISNKTLSQTPFNTRYVDDPNLHAGTVKKSQYGTSGYVVETYKTVKMGNDVISQTKLHTSRYKPCDEEFLVGILMPDGTITPGLAEQMMKQQASPEPGTTQDPSTPVEPEEQEETETPADPDTFSVPEETETPADPDTFTVPEETETPADPDKTAAPEESETQAEPGTPASYETRP